MIKIKQHTGRDATGKTVSHPFDNVFWVDGGQTRKVAILGHGPDAPLQWLVKVPDSVKKDIRKRAEAKQNERNQPTT